MKPLALFTLISESALALADADSERLELIKTERKLALKPARKATNKRYYDLHRKPLHPQKPGRPKGEPKAKTEPKKFGRPAKVLQLNVSRADIARMTGLSLTTVTKVLNGNRTPSPEVLVKIAEVLGITPEKLKRCISNAS